MTPYKYKQFKIICRTEKEFEEINKKAQELKYKRLECSTYIKDYLKDKRVLVLYLQRDGNWEYNRYNSMKDAMDNNEDLTSISDFLKEIKPDDFLIEIEKTLIKYKDIDKTDVPAYSSKEIPF